MTLAEQIHSAVSTATTAERCRVLVEELPGMLRQERNAVLAELEAFLDTQDFDLIDVDAVRRFLAALRGKESGT